MSKTIVLARIGHPNTNSEHVFRKLSHARAYVAWMRRYYGTRRGPRKARILAWREVPDPGDRLFSWPRKEAHAALVAAGCAR